MRTSDVSSRAFQIGPIVAALVFAACSGTAPASNLLSVVASPVSPSAGAIATSPMASTSPAPSLQSTQATPTASAGCPIHNGGQCLGPLAAGTYSTVTFSPTITYTVPAGWANIEDLPGNFSLLPPSGTAAGVNAGTSDYLGVFTSVAADGADCSAQPAAGVGLSASAIAHALATRPGLTTTAPKAATVGGLKGLVLDLKLKKGWTTQACPGGIPNVALIVGVSPSDLEHAIVGDFAFRLYLLDRASGVLAIEIDDSTGGKRLAGYDAVVAGMKFAAQ